LGILRKLPLLLRVNYMETMVEILEFVDQRSDPVVEIAMMLRLKADATNAQLMDTLTIWNN
jgi:hypothetical protein